MNIDQKKLVQKKVLQQNTNSTFYMKKLREVIAQLKSGSTVRKRKIWWKEIKLLLGVSVLQISTIEDFFILMVPTEK